MRGRLTVAHIHCTFFQFVLKNCDRGVRVWEGVALVVRRQRGLGSSIVWSEKVDKKDDSGIESSTELNVP